jgi:hypothetical protein
LPQDEDAPPEDIVAAEEASNLLTLSRGQRKRLAKKVAAGRKSESKAALCPINHNSTVDESRRMMKKRHAPITH